MITTRTLRRLYTILKGRVKAIETAYLPGGTDVALADGGTGASTNSAALTNLGILRAYLAEDEVYNADDTLGNITSMSVNVEAGAKYRIEAEFHVDIADATSGGLKIDFDGTSTITNFLGSWESCDATGAVGLNGEIMRITARGTDYTNGTFQGGSTAEAVYKFTGSVEVNAAGTFLPRGAQQTSHASDVTILEGATMLLTKI